MDISHPRAEANKGSRLILKKPKSQQPRGKTPGSSINKKAFKLGRYEVVGPQHESHHGRGDEYHQSSRRAAKDDRHFHSPGRGHDAHSNSDASAIELRTKSRIETSRGQLWRVDLKGDDHNIKYGRNNKWDIPKYYPTAGQGSVLGLDPAIKIDRAQTTETHYVLRYPAKVARARFEALVDEEGEADALKDDDGEEHEDREEGEDEVECSFQEVNHEQEELSVPIVTPKG